VLFAGLAYCVLSVLSASRSSAQSPKEVAPLDPLDGAVSGERPVFTIGYSGIEDSDLREARFRIVLSLDRFRSEAYVFDQHELRAGWLPGEPGQMLYRPRRPLDDGEYEWRVALWDGVHWLEGQQTYSLRIDTIPPADTEGLRLTYDRADDLVELRWDPVVLDRQGSAEFVARYHIYRYTGDPPYPVVRPLRAGSTPTPEWTDATRAGAERLVMYRVTAEDEAGNEPLRRD
jgi:hypothetical protein